MAQKPPMAREKLPKEVVEMDDRQIMERLFGKRAMEEADKVVASAGKSVKIEV